MKIQFLNFNIKKFSTTSLLLVDEQTNSPTSEGANVATSAQDSNNNSPGENNSPSVNNSHSPSDGYETDSNRDYWDQGTDAMTDHPVREIPDEKIRQFIRDTEDVKRHPEGWYRKGSRCIFTSNLSTA